MSILDKIKEEAEKIEEDFGKKPKVQTTGTIENPKVEELPKEEVVIPVESELPPVIKLYMGKQILSDKMEIVNEKEYHSIKLVDGSAHLLSQVEYDEMVK